MAVIYMKSIKNTFKKAGLKVAWPWLFTFLNISCSLPIHAQNLDVIDLQLRWHPQFQFAGYYAAVEKGFYRAEDLDVRLHHGVPDRQPVNEVLSGRAQYAEGNSEVLYQRLLGKPLVALASIFQHSPSVLLTRRDSGIRSAHDLIGRRVMMMNGNMDADFITMLLNEGVDPAQVNIIPSSHRIDDLVEGKTDAFNSYLTNEPYYLRAKGIEFNIIEPRNYRVDFYSDILFTSETEVSEHPDRVEAVLRATLKGWEYAMAHPEEIIDLLLTKYHVEKTREHLRYEVDIMTKLILPEMIQIGHMNPSRWRHMADTLQRAGLVENIDQLEGFIYQSDKAPGIPEWVWPTLVLVTILVLMVGSAATYYHLVNRKLKITETKLRNTNEELLENLGEIEQLQQRLEEQAIHDPLTNLYNRRYLDEILPRELARAEREQTTLGLAIIDIDNFKQINDKWGHLKGDAVLRSLAKVMQNHARDEDLPCRYGGDEFLLILPRLTENDALRRASEWAKIFKRDTQELLQGEVATLSIGIAVYPHHCGNPRELLLSADRALYRAKSGGRNRVVICEKY